MQYLQKIAPRTKHHIHASIKYDRTLRDCDAFIRRSFERLLIVSDFELRDMILHVHALLRRAAEVRKNRNTLIRELKCLFVYNDSCILHSIDCLPNDEAQQQAKKYDSLIAGLNTKSVYYMPRSAFVSECNDQLSSASSSPTEPCVTPKHDDIECPIVLDLSKPPPMLLPSDSMTAMQEAFCTSPRSPTAGFSASLGTPENLSKTATPFLAVNANTNELKINGINFSKFHEKSATAVLTPSSSQMTLPPLSATPVQANTPKSSVTMTPLMGIRTRPMRLSSLSAVILRSVVTPQVKKKRGGRKARAKRLVRYAAQSGIITTQVRKAANCTAATKKSGDSS